MKPISKNAGNSKWDTPHLYDLMRIERVTEGRNVVPLPPTGKSYGFSERTHENDHAATSGTYVNYYGPDTT